MTFLDERTHYAVIYFLKSKDQAFSSFKHYVAFAERDTNKKMKKVRTENGGEYTLNEWDTFCLNSGITHSPQLHGTAERFNRTLLDKILPLIFHAGLPVRFWEAGAHHAVSSYNLTPTRTNKGRAPPYTLWKSKPAHYLSLRAFGCKGYRLITGPTQGGKLSSKSNPCLHLHTLPDGDGWLVWDLRLNREVKTHNVVFYENDFPGLGQISGKTHSDWFSWSLDQCNCTQDPTARGRTRALWERRLSSSIHNPMNQTP